jgi:pyrroloquinoline quinone biosynthesis protein B
VAVSRDGTSWTLLGASPDLRQQVAATCELHPIREKERRSSPIEAVVLSNAEVDGVAGLLSLREGFVFDLFATSSVLNSLAANGIFDVLASKAVRRISLTANQKSRTSSGLEIGPFNVAGKIALHAEKQSKDLASRDGDTIGIQVSDPAAGASFFYIPACAAVDQDLARRLRGAQLVLFDGTLHTDAEMIVQGLSDKSGRRMGHMSMSGPEGSIAALAGLGIQRRVFVHINNSNPVLNEASIERMDVERAGWEIAFDGMEMRV